MVVVPEATLEVNVCAPVPEVNAKELVDALLPIVMASAPVAPVPMLIVSAPVPVPTLIVLVTESVVPIFNVVAAPPRERVVTVELNSVPVVVVEVMSADVEPLTAKSPEIVVSSDKVIAEDPESSVIFPVVDPPIVKVCILVVLITPAASRVRSPEMVAVGVPPATLIKPNLAEDVAVAPIKTSSDILVGERAPEFLCQ